MGRVASSVDNSMIESIWSTLQRELLDTHTWDRPDDLGRAIFDGSKPGQPPPATHLAAHARPAPVRNPSHHHRHRGMITTQPASGEPGQAPSGRGASSLVAGPCEG